MLSIAGGGHEKLLTAPKSHGVTIAESFKTWPVEKSVDAGQRG